MNTAPDLTTAAFKMVFSLGVVLLVVWALYRLAKGRLPASAMGGKPRHMEIVDSQYLGVKKSITMVKVPGSVLVLGIGGDSINLLTRIDDPEILDGIRTGTKKPRILGFKEHLNRLTGSRDVDSINTHNKTVAD